MVDPRAGVDHLTTGKRPDAFVCTPATPWSGTSTSAVRHVKTKKIGKRGFELQHQCRGCSHVFWEIDHLSHSQIELYRICGAAWEAKYERHIDHPASVPLLFGGAWGRTFERFFRARVAGQEEDVQAIWAAEWAISCQEPITWRGELPEVHENLGARMLASAQTRALLDTLEPLVEPAIGVAMERYTELLIPGVPIPTIGYVDLITNKRKLIDFKTAGRPWSPADHAKKIQGVMYLASLAQERWPLDTLEFTYLVWSKRPPHGVQVLTKTHTAADLFGVMQTIGAMWSGVQRQEFEPRKNWLMCNEWSCGIWQTCPVGGLH